MKEWKEIIFDECRECGHMLEALTNHDEDGWFYENDEVRCTGCDFTSIISVNEDIAYVL